jgi:hypothetical protein
LLIAFVGEDIDQLGSLIEWLWVSSEAHGFGKAQEQDQNPHPCCARMGHPKSERRRLSTQRR